MRFNPRLPNDTATLLLLAVFIIVLVGISHEVDDPASSHPVAISSFGAVALLSVYAVWLWGYLRTAGSGEPALEQTPHAALPFRVAVGLLAAAGVGAAFVSDWFVDALGPAIETLGISRAFTGIVIVGIAGNAVENVVGITLAAKGQSDLAISVIKNSVAQIAVFLFPALVSALALLRAPADVRDRTGGDRRARADGPLGLADHGRRRGCRVRGLGARRALPHRRSHRLVRVHRSLPQLRSSRDV